MDSIFIDYDDVLIGKIPYVDSYNFYGSSPGGPNELKALSCIRYALEKILEWTPEEVIARFDRYMIRLMRLDKIITYIDYPIEVLYGDPKYILSLLYPDRVHLNAKKLAEKIYKRVLDASDDADGPLKQFPREYFSGGKGFKRFCYCLNYLIENYKPMSSVDEVYSFFLSPDGKKFLYDYRLKVPADQFSIDMLDVIRYITKEEPDSELYYRYYLFSQYFPAIRKIKTIK